MNRKVAVLIFSALCAMSSVALADIYQVTVGFTDGTTYIPSDAPTYAVKYRVNGGPETEISALPTPGTSVSVTAVPGQPIDVAAKASNKGLESAWSGWVTATAPHPATQPQTPTGITITVIRTGP